MRPSPPRAVRQPFKEPVHAVGRATDLPPVNGGVLPQEDVARGHWRAPSDGRSGAYTCPGTAGPGAAAGPHPTPWQNAGMPTWLLPRIAALGAAALLGLALGGHARAEEAAQLLERLVDEPDPRAREARIEAARTAGTPDLAALLTAARAFGRFEPVAPGVHEVLVPRPGAGPHTGDRMAVFVPAGYDPSRPAPLLLALHGAGGRGADVVALWRAVAERLGVLVAAPTESGPNQGATFDPSERERTLAALRWTRRMFRVDDARVHVTGVSRGGHLAWDLALRHPDRFASLIPMIGGPRLHVPAGQNNLRYLENVAHLPIVDLQGAQDDPRLVANLRLAFERLEAFGARDAVLHLQPDRGHAFDATAVDWAAFLRRAARPHRPERVVRVAARPGEGRAAWVEILEFGRGVAEVFPLRVDARRWQALGEEGRRRFTLEEAERHSARLEVRRLGPGRFEARTRGVKRFRLLLEAEDLPPDGRVEVSVAGRRVRRTVRPDAGVLLREFAERFDPTFLPVAEVVVP